MEIVVRNKFFSLGGSSEVLDQNNEKLLIVKGKMFSATHKKFIKSLDGKLLYMVRNKYWKGIRPKSLIYDADKKLVARVIRDIKVRKSYTVEGATEDIKMVANGKIGLGFDMSILLGDKEIGHIVRPFNKLTETFNVTVNDPEDLAFMVAMVIAMDNIEDRQSADLD